MLAKRKVIDDNRRMRFIRKEHIVTTIFNKDLTKKEEIATVFQNLLDHRISFSMTMKKHLPLQYDSFNINFEKVRIFKIHENETLDLIAFKNGVKTTMKAVSFDDIVEVSATTVKNKILEIDSDVDRFDLLDL